VRRVSSGESQEKLAFVNSLLSEGRFEEAADEAAKILQADERSAAAHLAMGKAQQGLKKHEEALVSFKRACEIDPMAAAAHLMAGMSAFLCADYQFAEEKFRIAANIDAKLGPAYFGLAQVQFRRGDIDDAFGNVNKALKLNPELTPARLLRARILAKAGDSAGAIAQLKEVLDASPSNRAALLSLAAAHMQAENHAEAEACLLKALDQRPDDPIISAFLGRVRLRLKNYSGAEAAIRASMEKLPKMQRLGRSVLLAEALIGQQRFEDARKLLDEAPKSGSLAVIVNVRRGDIHLAQGHYQQSVACYRAALLESSDGEAQVLRLDSETANEDPARRAGSYRDAAQAQEAAARKAFAEQDWQSLLDKRRPVIAQFVDSFGLEPM
jgi:tetratricopeptide (TPR) repeat protein